MSLPSRSSIECPAPDWFHAPTGNERIWIGLALIWKKLFGDKVQVAPRAETPEGEATEIGMGAHIPFGPMLAIAALLHFFCFSAWMDDYFAELAAMFQ